LFSVKDEWLKAKGKTLRQLLVAIFSWLTEIEWHLRGERQLAAWEARKQKGRPPKISDEELEYYLRKYPTLSLNELFWCLWFFITVVVFLFWGAVGWCL